MIFESLALASRMVYTDNTGKTDYFVDKEGGLRFNNSLSGMSSHIRDALNGKRRTSYGYVWHWMTREKYIDIITKYINNYSGVEKKELYGIHVFVVDINMLD